MKYRVLLSTALLEELDAMHGWIECQASQLRADNWLASAFRALRSLESLPRRHPAALEARLMPELDLRQLLFGRVRVLFTVTGDEVRAAHARHSSRRPATREELARPEHWDFDTLRERGPAWVPGPLPALV